MDFTGKTVFAIALVAAATTSATAQEKSHEYKVKGIVADSTTNAGEPYATLSIIQQGGDGKPLKLATTDADGKFNITAKGEGKYTLVVRSMGRNDIRRDFTVGRTDKVIDLGRLQISDSKTELKGVEVVAYKPLVKAEIDKLTYNIEDDPESKVSTVMDMLKKVPMVTVDGQDNIKVNGSTSFKVYVNGKPSNMMTNNPKEVLKSMPASSIKEIEVITNPGPKYDAEGVGGILNIITEGKGPEGYSATFTLRGQTDGGGGGVFATVKKDKLTVSLNYNNNFSDEKPQYGGNVQQVIDDSGNVTQQTDYNSSSKTKSQWHSGSLEASYEIDSLRLVTASFSAGGYLYKANSESATRAYIPSPLADMYSYAGRSHSEGSFSDISGGLDYQRSFKNVKDRLLTFSYRIESTPSKSKNRQTYDGLKAGEAWTDYLRSVKNQYADGDGNSMEQTFQIDYTTPFAKHHTLETGAKYILRQNKSTNDKYNIPENGGDEYAYDEENSSHFKHRNDIFAAYAGYGLSLDKWSARLGLRYEHTLQKVTYLLGKGQDFSKNFDDLVPSAKVGYKFSDTSNMSLSYSMRINRPGIWYLNPYLDDSNILSVSQGNSSLVSEKNHAVALQFNSFGRKLSYGINATYSFTNNSIESVMSMMNDRDIAGLENPSGRQIMYTTYQNIGKSQILNFTGYASWTPFTDTRITVNAWGGYSHLSDGQSLKNHGWNMSVYANIQQTIAKTWTVSASVYKQTPQINLQGKTDEYFMHSFSVTKKMLKDRLSITLSADNPFQKYFTFRSDYSGSNFKTSPSVKFHHQRFAISASFRIGKLESSVKKVERSIVNDDEKKGGGNSKGSK